jgi:hypothetical protein
MLRQAASKLRDMLETLVAAVFDTGTAWGEKQRDRRNGL